MGIKYPFAQDKKNTVYARSQTSAVGYLLRSKGIRVPVLTFYNILRTKASTELKIKIVILLNVTSCNAEYVHTHQPFGDVWYGCWMKFLRYYSAFLPDYTVFVLLTRKSVGMKYNKV